MFRNLVLMICLVLSVNAQDESGARRLRRNNVLEIQSQEHIADMVQSLWEVDGLEFEAGRHLQMSMSMSM